MQNPVRLVFLAILSSTSFFISCNSNPQHEMNSKAMEKTDSAAIPKFTAAMVDNRKDPSCGMPVTAGIEDTVHYMGKVYGFCSEECKNEFLKNPDALVKNAELK